MEATFKFSVVISNHSDHAVEFERTSINLSLSEGQSNAPPVAKIVLENALDRSARVIIPPSRLGTRSHPHPLKDHAELLRHAAAHFQAGWSFDAAKTQETLEEVARTAPDLAAKLSAAVDEWHQTNRVQLCMRVAP